MFAMTASFGLPCVLFTITPEDAVNFRIRVMAKGEAGSQIPPSVGSEEGFHRDYVMESEKIRIENPGLCAIDFENVIGIVVEEILGWDRKNNWYNELIEGLSTPEGQEEYVKKVSKYVDRVMSTRLHGFNPRSVPNACNNDCTSVDQGIEGYLKCTTQDLRQLRTKHGETSFGGKKLLWCPTCNVKVSSEDLTFKRLKRYFGNALLGENETLWSTSRHLSKCRLLMEMEVLHAMLPSECQAQVQLERFAPSSRLKFIVTALRNLHRSEHCPSCFKKGHECRMKIPYFPSTETFIKFDDKFTKWFDWKGNDVSRPLSICVAKRAHVDAFVNVNRKSHVIKTVCRYAQKLCEELRVKFDKRSIVVTALTGAAAVSINGETTAKAFAFKREVRNELEEFKNAYLVIVDEVSFAHKGPLEKNIPPDAVHATKTNVNRMATNDAIFVKHLEKTHSTDANVQPLMHTLCIRAGTLRFHVRGTRKEYHAMEKKAQDIIYASVGEAHVQDKTKKYHDPLLKLYHGRPLCINQNEDVSGCIANGAMCEFRCVKLKPGVSITDFETILIDGYCVNCVCVTQIESMVVKMLDWTTGGDEEHLIELKPKTIYESARFPVPCTALRGLFLREPLNPNMTKGMSEELVAGNAMFFLSVP
ncbi:hypothetical protein IV203_013847 [Nitzschia inconspicua]|uniref:Uncharacterized protein n=1 Tax=Nitzschia inconspicua TaxID=303405 RepID=A0A9K3K565_9STRA|nr:hypothetical protein IV203_014193 [Nitzschia inconspicua]KAG7374752.1 hypothetical protein IV203_013847 [Nitzschia inconspicua]